MPQSDLRIIAARYAIGILESRALAPAADEAIDGGIYTPDLADVAAARHPIMSDVGSLFERALAELNIPLPPPAEAAQSVLRDLILRIADGRMAPRAGVAELNKLHDATCALRSREEVLGECFGIEVLVGSHYAYDDLENPAAMCSFDGLVGREAVLALDAALVLLARRWLIDHP